MGIQNVRNIKIVRCYYLNEQKQIIARFQSYTDSELVWASRYKLNNTNIFFAEDFPSAIVSRRKQLYPVCKAAKSIPAYHKKVTMRGDKLILMANTTLIVIYIEYHVMFILLNWQRGQMPLH